MIRSNKIYTSFYKNKKINNRDHIPIGISLYHPRFRLGYKVVGRIQLLMPTKAEFNSKSLSEFTKKYRTRITNNIEEIKKELEAFQEEGKTIVLLCYEDIQIRPCHRRIFAEVWQEFTGQKIEEL